MKKVYVYKCEVHGEMELQEELTEAFCPKCGKKMIKTGEYEE